MPLSDLELGTLIKQEEHDARDDQTDIAEKRVTLMEYYNQEPYGNEVDGMSSIVTSDVSDVVESILPSLMRVYAQGKQIAKFTSDIPEGDDEAEEKTLYANHVFLEQNDGLLILHGMFKDALLQYSGTAKCWWEDKTKVTTERYKGLTREEVRILQAQDDIEITEIMADGDGADITLKRTKNKGMVKVGNIPPEQMRICKNATTWNSPRFMGQETPKTRSQLVEMGFDKDTVYSLPAHDYRESEVEDKRNYDLNDVTHENPAAHTPNDVIMLGEYYYYVDVDGDGIAELWQVFYAGERVLKKQQFDNDPYATCVPIPMPHRAIGTCPADQVADLQRVKSELVRNVLNNAYLVNYSRTAVNERVDLDDLLTPEVGGVIRVEGDGPIADSMQPFVVQPQIDQLLGAIEYTDTMRENRTGITRFNQGLDADTLNQTATGFKGLMGASQQREQLIAMMMSVGVKTLFEKIIDTAQRHQKEPTTIRTPNGAKQIDPSQWKYDTSCSVQVGIGSGDRQEKIANLNYILQLQKEYMQTGSVLSDETKQYNTLDALVEEVGLRDVVQYFNNPEQPNEVLAAQNKVLMDQLDQAMSMLENPLAEAERIKAEKDLMVAQGRLSLDEEKVKLDQYNKERDREFKYTELEVKENTDIAGVGLEREATPSTGGGTPPQNP